MAEHWIANATKNKGALHQELGISQGKDIPQSILAKAAHSKNKKLRKRAILAETLEHMHH